MNGASQPGDRQYVHVPQHSWLVDPATAAPPARRRTPHAWAGFFARLLGTGNHGIFEREHGHAERCGRPRPPLRLVAGHVVVDAPEEFLRLLFQPTVKSRQGVHRKVKTHSDALLDRVAWTRAGNVVFDRSEDS